MWNPFKQIIIGLQKSLLGIYVQQEYYTWQLLILIDGALSSDFLCLLAHMIRCQPITVLHDNGLLCLLSMTHCAYFRKVLGFFDYSVYSYHNRHIMSFEMKMQHVFNYWFYLVNQPFHTYNLNIFLPGMLLSFQISLINKIFWFYAVVAHSYPVSVIISEDFFVLDVQIEKLAIPYNLRLFSLKTYSKRA